MSPPVTAQAAVCRHCLAVITRAPRDAWWTAVGGTHTCPSLWEGQTRHDPMPDTVKEA